MIFYSIKLLFAYNIFINVSFKILLLISSINWMLLKKITLPVIVFFALLALISCNILDPEEEIPSYISIEKISFKTNVFGDNNSHEISDAWVYVDDQIVGVYQLPARFPVLFSGKKTITVKPGIKLNGIKNTRAAYPFYQSYDTTLILTPAQSVYLSPKTSYSQNAEIVWWETFENPNITLKKALTSDTTFKLSPNTGIDYFEYGGKFAGVINLTQMKSYFECITDTLYVLSSGDRASFLELNYKTNNSFTISVIVVSSKGIIPEEYLTINPSDTWKKIYVNLTPITNLYSDVYGYKIFFHHRINAGVTEAKILIDNIKLIKVKA